MRLTPLLFTFLFAFAVRADVGASLDDYFQRAAAHGFSGSVLVARGKEVLLRKGYGQADRRTHVPASPETAYNIASLDKQFIAAAVLRLEELGKLRTSDPLTRFFDFVPEEKKTITLHQLLSHTSGLRNEYWDEHPTLSREQFVRLVLAEEPLESAPGTAWSYSNSAFIVLERVIELASGRPYEQFLHDELFVPVGMAFSGFSLPRGSPTRRRTTTSGPLMRRRSKVMLPMTIRFSAHHPSACSSRRSTISGSGAALCPKCCHRNRGQNCGRR